MSGFGSDHGFSSGGRRSGKSKSMRELLQEMAAYGYPRRDPEGLTFEDLVACRRCGGIQHPAEKFCVRCRFPMPVAEEVKAANGYGTGRKARWKQYPKGYRGQSVSFVMYLDGEGDAFKVPLMDRVVSNEPRTVEEYPCYDNGVFFIIDEVKDEEWNVYAWEEDGKIEIVPHPEGEKSWRRKFEAMKFADECLANELEDGAM